MNCRKIISTFTAMLVFSSPIHANDVISKLQNTPASSFDLGVFKLHYLLDTKYKNNEGSRLDGTKFDFQRIGASGHNNKIFIGMYFKAAASDMNNNACLEAIGEIKKRINLSSSFLFSWPGLDKKEIEQLELNTVYGASIESKENSSLVIKCTELKT